MMMRSVLLLCAPLVVAGGENHGAKLQQTLGSAIVVRALSIERSHVARVPSPCPCVCMFVSQAAKKQ